MTNSKSKWWGEFGVRPRNYKIHLESHDRPEFDFDSWCEWTRKNIIPNEREQLQ